MNDNKINKFLLITTIISVGILLIGATFSYFTISNMSKVDAVSVSAGKIGLGLGVSDLTSGLKLIPTNDEDIMIAYERNCIDDRGFGACNIFGLSISNFAKEQDVIGKINFNVENIENLSYMILDENDNIYLTKTSIPNGTSTSSMGEHFILNEGTDLNPIQKNFKLVVWLTNINEEQNEYDAGGTYTATVTYESVDGSILTGTIKGIKSSNNGA